VDCQVETPSGAVALAELVDGPSDIMVRTAAGPRLVSRGEAVS
jgi:phosphoribosyl-dephospho-CoA transferase